MIDLNCSSNKKCLKTGKAKVEDKKENPSILVIIHPNLLCSMNASVCVYTFLHLGLNIKPKTDKWSKWRLSKRHVMHCSGTAEGNVQQKKI